MIERGATAHVLATSREPLGVAGEHVWPLGPLHERSAGSCSSSAPVPPSPGCTGIPADPAVIELCRRLDDVPLALELAAGQLRRFDLDELNRRLDDRLALLSGRAAVTSAARHDGDGDRLELPAARRRRAVPAPAPQRVPGVVRRRRRGGVGSLAAGRRGRRGVRSAGGQEPGRPPARHRAVPAPRDDPRVRQGPAGGDR